MNCKPGDLAIVVNDIEYPQNNGALLRVVSRLRPSDRHPFEWRCEPLSTFHFGERVCYPGHGVCVYRDIELKPLRDGDGQDETLAWAGLPAPILQPA